MWIILPVCAINILYKLKILILGKFNSKALLVLGCHCYFTELNCTFSVI